MIASVVRARRSRPRSAARPAVAPAVAPSGAGGAIRGTVLAKALDGALEGERASELMKKHGGHHLGAVAALLAVGVLLGGCGGEVVVASALESLGGCGASASPSSQLPPPDCSALVVGRWLMCDGPHYDYENDGLSFHADGSLQGLDCAADGTVAVSPSGSGYVAWACDPASDQFTFDSETTAAALTTNAPRFSADGQTMWLGLDPYLPSFGRLK